VLTVVSTTSLEASIGIDILQSSIDLRLFIAERHYITLKVFTFFEANFQSHLESTNANLALAYHFNLFRLFKYFAIGTDIGIMLELLDVQLNRSWEYYVNLGTSIDFPLSDKLHIFLNAPILGIHRVKPTFFDPFTVLQLNSYPWEFGLQVRF
jgi:hypothetical protein